MSKSWMSPARATPFCSSFLFALSLDKGIKYAAEFANAAASICVSRLGARAGAVSRQEIERIMRL